MIKQSDLDTAEIVENIENNQDTVASSASSNINSADNSAENFAIQANLTKQKKDSKKTKDHKTEETKDDTEEIKDDKTEEIKDDKTEETKNDKSLILENKKSDKKDSQTSGTKNSKDIKNQPLIEDDFDSESYKVHLDNFEGPLDLLLYLIKEAKIDIKDIFISKVTNQYLSYMQNINQLDLEKASEFLNTAATILEIKSNSLLPKIETIAGDTEDPAKKMIRKLEEYKIIKESAEKLKEMEEVNRFYRLPDDSVYNVKIILKDMTLDGLLDAFSRLMSKVTQRQLEVSSPKEIARDPFTVDEKITYIRETLKERKSVMFSELFEGDYNKSEVITTFQAMLELIRRQFLDVIQKDNYEDISIILSEESVEEALVG